MKLSNRATSRWWRQTTRSSALRILLGTFVSCLVVVWAPPRAPAASDALWIADFSNGRIDEYLPNQLKISRTPTAFTIPETGNPLGVCFDQSKNLWVMNSPEQIVEFTAKELKRLPTVPVPAVTITSSSFSTIEGCTFDKHGNLWLADVDNSSVDEVSAAQLKAGSGSITPAVIITSSELASPGFVTFDKSGNLWSDSRGKGELVQFSASELNSGGLKSVAVILQGGGSLSDPGQIAFDRQGNLWVTSYGDGTVVMFQKAKLSASNDDEPNVMIGSSSLVGPWGLAFRDNDLWLLDFNDGNGQEFLSKQIKSSGSPAPKILLNGAAAEGAWQITFGPVFGK